MFVYQSIFMGLLRGGLLQGITEKQFWRESYVLLGQKRKPQSTRWFSKKTDDDEFLESSHKWVGRGGVFSLKPSEQCESVDVFPILFSKSLKSICLNIDAHF